MITCSVYAKDRGKWRLVEASVSPETALNVLRAWAAKGFAVKIITD